MQIIRVAALNRARADWGCTINTNLVSIGILDSRLSHSTNRMQKQMKRSLNQRLTTRLHEPITAVPCSVQREVSWTRNAAFKDTNTTNLRCVEQQKA